MYVMVGITFKEQRQSNLCKGPYTNGIKQRRDEYLKQESVLALITNNFINLV